MRVLRHFQRIVELRAIERAYERARHCSHVCEMGPSFFFFFFFFFL